MLPETQQISPPNLHPDLLKLRKEVNGKDLLGSVPQKRMSLSNQPMRRFSAMANNDNSKRNSIQDYGPSRPLLEISGQAHVGFRRSSVQQVNNIILIFFISLFTLK